MQQLVNTLTQAIDQIQSAMTLVDNKANSVQWQGPDADTFKGSTWPNSKGQLNNVITDLTDVRSKVTTQRQQQIDASAQ
ncbi:hypothetical protein CVV67_11020 [Arthrobacter stackebrandtii]|nr:hypothetical protein CVV67_11020 [Arthrobacter stackebrandtii]